eukprot:CAMPEP_0170328578 /NCGR_PEP_ID=MMETSP0116_2-20130129/65198_1 /TAXON_ID=400756 /ORGANISM="Durinskia baltica, Strain CSIRO CS-38" /LENGTH=30 /DNA_ID= /DNA_START= /DNA_END= /DNA_ORIENTATION=
MAPPAPDKIMPATSTTMYLAPKMPMDHIAV